MKKAIFLVSVTLMLSCQNEKSEPASISTEPQKMDIQAEQDSIEETRNGFQLAIKENRFADLQNYATNNVKSLTPDCGPWAAFKNLRAEPTGKFQYDSLVMRPRETIIVSDSVAYDFGMSSTYYTDENGQSVELTATF